MEREATDNEADHSAAPAVGGEDDFWMEVNAPLTKTQAGLLAGGLVTVGAAVGTAGSIFFGNRSPKDKVRITSSAAGFAFKALMAGTAVCLSGAFVVGWLTTKAMGVHSVNEFAHKMRNMLSKPAAVVGLSTSKEVVQKHREMIKAGGKEEEGKSVLLELFGLTGFKLDAGDEDVPEKDTK